MLFLLVLYTIPSATAWLGGSPSTVQSVNGCHALADCLEKAIAKGVECDAIVDEMEKTLDDEETCQHRVVNSRWHSQHYRRLETLQACYRETTQNEELSPRTGRQCDKLHSLIENGDNRIRIKRKRMSKKKQASSAYEKANGLLSACLKQVQMLKAECRPYYPCCTVLDDCKTQYEHSSVADDLHELSSRATQCKKTRRRGYDIRL